jgi:phenylalanine-4-hydroxylase
VFTDFLTLDSSRAKMAPFEEARMTTISRPIETQADVEFSPAEHSIWRQLFARQAPQVQAHACREYLEGSRLLGLPADRVPSIDFLTVRIAMTGWKTCDTVRYSDAVSGARRAGVPGHQLRSRRNRADFTPEPDMFHDVYGHLPYFCCRVYRSGSCLPHSKGNI